MSDTFADVYPIPVEFVDGQQPTARFLNAWAEQIDNAFSLFSGVVGDIHHTSAAETELAKAPFINNFTRVLGSMGVVFDGLMENQTTSAGASPYLEETVTPGQKEVWLTFRPQLGLICSTPGVALPGRSTTLEGLGSGEYYAEGRRIIFHSGVPIGTTRLYYIPGDPYLINGRPLIPTGSGPNIIPGIFDVTDTSISLCSAGAVASRTCTITLPVITKVSNPADPFRATSAINLGDLGSSVNWVSGSAATYSIPDKVWNTADESGVFPANSMSLWVRSPSSGALTKIGSNLAPGEILFIKDGTNKKAIRVTLPVGSTFPHEADAGLTSQYVLVVGGLSIADAVAQNRADIRSHSHSGLDMGRPVSTQDLSERFDHSRWTFSNSIDDPFPQYLRREGYVSADATNGKNGMLGTLFLGSSAINEDSPDKSLSNDLNHISHSIFWGAYGSGPYLRYNPDPTNQTENFGKLQVGVKDLWVDTGAIHLGPSSDSCKMDYEGGGILSLIPPGSELGITLQTRTITTNTLFAVTSQIEDSLTTGNLRVLDSLTFSERTVSSIISPFEYEAGAGNFYTDRDLDNVRIAYGSSGLINRRFPSAIEVRTLNDLIAEEIIYEAARIIILVKPEPTPVSLNRAIHNISIELTKLGDDYDSSKNISLFLFVDGSAVATKSGTVSSFFSVATGSIGFNEAEVSSINIDPSTLIPPQSFFLRLLVDSGAGIAIKDTVVSYSIRPVS